MAHGGQEFYPYQVALKPGRPYDPVLNGGFRSADGRPLKTYEVKFTTKP